MDRFGSLIWLTLLSLLCAGGCGLHKPVTPQQQAEKLFKLGSWQATIDATTPLLNANPYDRDLLTWRGQSHVALKQYKEAIADFTRLIQSDPHNPEGFYLRQLAFARAGMHALADADGRQARNMDPKYKTAYKFDPSNFSPGIDPELLANATPRARASEDDAKEQADDQESLAASESDGVETDLWGRPRKGNDSDRRLNLRPTEDGKSTDRMVSDDRKLRNQSLSQTQESPPVESLGVRSPSDRQQENTPTAPERPVGPEAPEKKQEGTIAKWMAEHGRDVVERDRFGNRGQSKGLTKPIRDTQQQPAAYTPPISTALPPGASGITSAPHGFGGIPQVSSPAGSAESFFRGPRSTGLSSRPIAASPLGRPTTVAQSRNHGATGLSSGLPRNMQVSRPQAAGLQPGQFQGNTLHAPGSAPTLTTSLPIQGSPSLPGTGLRAPTNLGPQVGAGAQSPVSIVQPNTPITNTRPPVLNPGFTQ